MNSPRKPWKLIFNWDSGNFFNMPWWVTDGEVLRERLIKPLLTAGNDAVTLAEHTTDVLYRDSNYAEYLGQYHGVFEDTKQWERHLWVKNVIQMAVLPREARKVGPDVLASFRMNDTQDLYYSKDHPELLIKDGRHWAGLCLDYALLPVRERRVILIRETVERFDVDGVELDSLRNGFFFSRGMEIKNSYLMTWLVERIRNILDCFGKERNKYLTLAVHVPVTQEVSINCGLNVTEWMGKGLVDVVIADEGCVPFAVAPEDFIKEASKNGSCSIYSTCDLQYGNPERPEEDRGCDSPGVSWTREQLRGWAAYQLDRGVDGLNIFNGHYDPNMGPEILGDVFSKRVLEGMGKGDKTFVVQNRAFTANMPKDAYPHIKMLSLPITRDGSGESLISPLL